MDLSKIGRNTWIMVGGTIGVFLGIVVFPWYSVSIGPFSSDLYAWDVNSWGKLAWLGMLVMIVGVVVLLLPNPPELPVPAGTVVLGASGFTAVMVVIEWLDHHSYTAFGLYLSLVGALVAAYGAFAAGHRVSMPTRTGTGAGPSSEA
jgi:MFS family permease